jgi:hypothetical protein
MGRKSKTLGLLLIVVIILVILAFVTVKPHIPIDNISTAPSNDNAVITIQSPQDGATYNVTSLPLYFTVQNNYQSFSVRYILNSQRPVTIPAWTINQTSLKGYFSDYNYTYYYPRYTAVSNTVLPNLTNGNYNLTIENFYDVSTGVQVTNSTSIIFTIDSSHQNGTVVFQLPAEHYPKLTICSFDSPTKNVATNGDSYAQVDVTFNLTEIPSWVGYSIDGKSNQTISGFSAIYGIQTAINVPLETHTVTLYTKDTAGNWALPVTFYSTVISFKDYTEGKTASNALLAPST